MCTHQHIQSHLITTEIMKPTINKEQLKASIAESKNIIEMRYQLEKKLMNAISKGDKDDVARFSNETIRIVDFSDQNTRKSDSICQKYIIGFKYIV